MDLRPVRAAFLCSALLVFACFAAKATTSFGFSHGGYDIQFVGRDFSPEFSGVIEVAWGRGKRTTLPHGQYKLTSYRYRESLKLEFSGTSDPSQPPAFVLVVAGETATLEVDGQIIHGSFGWDG